MAKKNDIDAAAAKAKKQKIILAVAGVALLGLGVIQGPKLLKGGGSSEPSPAAEAAAATGTPGTATATASATAVSATTPSGTSVTAVRVSRPAPTTVLAGVKIRAHANPGVDAGQLIAFTMFEEKDPFVQQASDEATSTNATTTTTTTAATTETPPPTATGGSATATTPATKPPPVKYATILLDNKPQYLQVKQKFPTTKPLFVLVSVKSKKAKIGVAGGSFDDGATVTLVQGKQVTLVDTATGVRYVLKLVYTGPTPEVVQGFSSTDGQAQAPTTETPAPSASSGSTAAAPTP